MTAVLPLDWESVPLRRTCAADKALAWVRQDIDLTPREQERFRLHIEIANRAAWSAARSAANSAALSAANSAANSAARSAAWSAARSAQCREIRRLIPNVDRWITPKKRTRKTVRK